MLQEIFVDLLLQLDERYQVFFALKFEPLNRDRFKQELLILLIYRAFHSQGV